MHPLVRDLYKRVVLVGRDYPGEWKSHWKKALRSYDNNNNLMGDSTTATTSKLTEAEQEKRLRAAIGKGRQMVREMEGIVQLKKYRAMQRRYGKAVDEQEKRGRILQEAIEELHKK